MRWLFSALSVAVFGVSFLPAPVAGEGLDADAIFSRARSVWRQRSDPPFVQYALRERYTWRDRVHDNWWQVSYRENDRALALHRQIVAEQEEARLKGTPITLRFKLHNGFGRVDSLETNADADAFPILDPQIEPDASFGLLRNEAKIALVGPVLPSSTATAQSASASASPAFGGVLASGTPVPETPASGTSTYSDAAPSSDKALRVLVTVEAASRDYRIVLDGTERFRDREAFHLTLTPLRNPAVYRLREMWVDTTTFATLQISVAGLFEGEPYRSARWTVSYVDVDGHSYIQQIHTDDQLRFGADRFVTGLQFDFVQYDLPATLPDMMFEHYL